MSNGVRVETLAEGVTLYCGDMLEILPTLGSVDHIFCDPPYEDELHEAIGRIRRNDGREMIGDLGFAGVNATRNEIARTMVSASTGWLIAFCLAEGVMAWRDVIQPAGGKWDTTLFWVKPDASPRFNGQGAARGAECAVTAWCGKGYRSWNGGGKRGVFTYCVNQGRQGEHPTEKPIPLMLEIVSLYSNIRQMVCDPFMGSGTTGIACVKLGRNFIGVERDPKWFDLACRRIEDALARPDLFIQQRVREKQESLL